MSVLTDQELHNMAMNHVGKELEKHGVNIIHVSSGISGWRRPAHREGEGYLVADASEIQKHINIPVIGVGGIETGLFIDELVSDQKVDFTAVGRAILSNPLSWGQAHLPRSKYSCGVAV